MKTSLTSPLINPPALAEQASQLAGRISSPSTSPLTAIERVAAQELGATLRRLSSLFLPSQLEEITKSFGPRALDAVREVQGSVLEPGENTPQAHRRLLWAEHQAHQHLDAEVSRRLDKFNEIMEELSKPDRVLLAQLARSGSKAEAIETLRLEREGPKVEKPGFFERLWSLGKAGGPSPGSPAEARTEDEVSALDARIEALTTQVKSLNDRIAETGVTGRIWVPFEGPPPRALIPPHRWDVHVRRDELKSKLSRDSTFLRSVTLDLTVLRASIRQERSSPARLQAERTRMLGQDAATLYAEAKQTIRDLESRAEVTAAHGTLEARASILSTSTSSLSEPAIGVDRRGNLVPRERLVGTMSSETSAAITGKTEYPLANGQVFHFRIAREPGLRTIMPGEDGHVFDRALKLVRLAEAMELAHPASNEAREISSFVRNSSLVVHDGVPDRSQPHFSDLRKPVQFHYPLADLRRTLIEKLPWISPAAEYDAAKDLLLEELMAPLGRAPIV